MKDALIIKGLSKRFGGLRAVQDVSFTVKENETVALIGPNGAGKTTSFHLITGFHRADSGSVQAFGREIDGLRPHDVCALGLARTFLIAKPFRAMTVLANVMQLVYEILPRLAERKRQLAGTMSGGEQQMLAVGRGLMLKPRLLMPDEPSLGLAPLMTDVTFEKIGEIHRMGTAILLVEQNVSRALSLARLPAWVIDFLLGRATEDS